MYFEEFGNRTLMTLDFERVLPVHYLQVDQPVLCGTDVHVCIKHVTDGSLIAEIIVIFVQIVISANMVKVTVDVNTLVMCNCHIVKGIMKSMRSPPCSCGHINKPSRITSHQQSKSHYVKQYVFSDQTLLKCLLIQPLRHST